MHTQLFMTNFVIDSLLPYVSDLISIEGSFKQYLIVGPLSLMVDFISISTISLKIESLEYLLGKRQKKDTKEPACDSMSTESFTIIVRLI